MISKYPKIPGLSWQSHMIKTVRTTHGMTQKQLAKYVGSNVNHVIWWENEAVICPDQKIKKILMIADSDIVKTPQRDYVYDRLSILIKDYDILLVGSVLRQLQREM